MFGKKKPDRRLLAADDLMTQGIQAKQAGDLEKAKQLLEKASQMLNSIDRGSLSSIDQGYYDRLVSITNRYLDELK